MSILIIAGIWFVCGFVGFRKIFKGNPLPWNLAKTGALTVCMVFGPFTLIKMEE